MHRLLYLHFMVPLHTYLFFNSFLVRQELSMYVISMPPENSDILLSSIF